MRHPKRTITRAIRTWRPLHPGRDADELEAQRWPGSAIPVGDCISRGVATIHSDALVRGATEMMRTRRIRHLPVVDCEGRLVGIVTDRDLRQVIFDPSIQSRAGAAADILGRLTVRDVMTWGVITARPDTAIAEAARRMHEQKIGALPVVEGRQGGRHHHRERHPQSLPGRAGPGRAGQALPLGLLLPMSRRDAPRQPQALAGRVPVWLRAIRSASG